MMPPKGRNHFSESVQKNIRALKIERRTVFLPVSLSIPVERFCRTQDRSFRKNHFGNSFDNQCRSRRRPAADFSRARGLHCRRCICSALSVESFIVRGVGRIFLGGPPIVKAALKKSWTGYLVARKMHTY